MIESSLGGSTWRGPLSDVVLSLSFPFPLGDCFPLGGGGFFFPYKTKTDLLIMHKERTVKNLMNGDLMNVNDFI